MQEKFLDVLKNQTGGILIGLACLGALLYVYEKDQETLRIMGGMLQEITKENNETDLEIATKTHEALVEMATANQHMADSVDRVVDFVEIVSNR